MDIAVIGSEGSMGRRYSSILKYLGKNFKAVDKTKNYLGEIEDAIKHSSHIILATPTDTHIKELMRIYNLNRDARILCEKPITKEIHMFELIKDMDITMQMQYRELVHESMEGYSYFNFYNHGRDGLIWDCFQIIALANGDVDIYEDSPIWECAINGHQLNITDMDMAYITYTDKWIKGYKSDFDELLLMHKKVEDYAQRR